MREQNSNIPAEQVYGMFEEIKEMIEKRPAPEAFGGTAENSETIIRKLDENKSAIDRNAKQITALTNRIGQIDFRPVVRMPPPDMKDVNDAFDRIKDNSASVAANINGIRADIRTVLSDEKIERTVRQAAGREAEQYKTMLDDHWNGIDRLLEHLKDRIPYNYDINKRLVKWRVWLTLLFGLSATGFVWQWRANIQYRENDWKFRYTRAVWHGKVELINDLDRIFDRQEKDNIDDIKQTVNEYEKEIKERGTEIVNKE